MSKNALESLSIRRPDGIPRVLTDAQDSHEGNVFASGLAKAFRIKDRMTLRAEITGANIFNHPNWSNPAVVVNALQSAGIIRAA